MNMLLDKLDLRQIYLLTGSVAFLSLTALAMFVAKPQYQRYQSVSLELESLHQLSAQETSPALQPFQRQVEDYERNLLGELQHVPTRQLESHIIAALQNSAWQSEINLISVEPIETAADLPYQEIAFRLEIEGAYYNLSDWVDRVSEQLGYVVFKEYALKIEQAGIDPRLSARVLLAAYRVNEV